MNNSHKTIDELASYYAEKFPARTALILESGDLEQVHEFLSKIDLENLLHLLEYLTPLSAHAFLQTISWEKIIKIFENLSPEFAAPILRIYEKTERQKILLEIPEKKAKTLKVLLNFSEGTVGAYMSPFFLEFPQEMKIAEVKKRIKGYAKKNFSYFYTCDSNGLLKGRIQAMDLLGEEDSLALFQVQKNPKPVIRYDQLMEEISHYVEWKKLSEIPVVDDRQQILGILKSSAMIKYLKKISQKAPTLFNTFAHLSELSWVGMGATTNLILETVYKPFLGRKNDG